MAAEPTRSPVRYLEPVPSVPQAPDPVASREGLTELALALETQRSANKAMLEAVKTLDRMLAEQRARTEAVEAQLVEYATAVTQQVSENRRLRDDAQVAEHRLAEELEKPFWRRLFKS